MKLRSDQICGSQARTCFEASAPHANARSSPEEKRSDQFPSRSVVLGGQPEVDLLHGSADLIKRNLPASR